MPVLLLWTLISVCFASDFRTPAGIQPARRTEEGAGTILPGGRLLSPYGTEYTTGPGPFGLAVSPSGNRIVTSDGGPDRFSLSFLEKTAGVWKLRRLALPVGKDDDDDEDEWKSAFMGLAFDDENTLYASEGESGRVRVIDPASGRKLFVYKLDTAGFANSYAGDLALDRERELLYVADQANFRVAIFDTRKHRFVSSIAAGRLPFAVALSPDRRRLYVTDVGMFSYSVLPGADSDHARETGIEFPAFGFPSRESMGGTVRKNGSGKRIVVPGLGDPNVPQSNSLCVVDVSDPAKPKLIKFIRTGRRFGRDSLGGSSPSGVLPAGGRIFVSNSANDTISVIDPDSLEITGEIALRIPGLESLRGIIPIGMAYDEPAHRLLVAEAGINAVGVIDAGTLTLRAHIPAAWFPTRVAVFGDSVYVSNAKGHGIGPNATLDSALPRSFQLERRRGSLSRYSMPDDASLPRLTETVIANNGFSPVEGSAALPAEIRHLVLIVKENRTFAEVFGDIGGAPKLARYGRKVTPNQHALAGRFAMSDNFYADSEVSVDGHHWLVGSYPSEWTESTLMAAYGGAKSFKLAQGSPGRLEFPGSNSSVHPEDMQEAGTLWNHLDRNRISFRNYGEGFELAGVDEGKGLKPTGARYLTNVPMPEPLYRNTARDYPQFNMNIPDQFRAAQFIKDVDARYIRPNRPLPSFIFIHLPQDHTADPRPEDGYPTRAAFVADNDLALGRIVEYLSHTPAWSSMAIFITEDDAQSGVDPVDAHRTVLLMVSPYAKPACVAHTNTSFVSLLKTMFRIFSLPPLNLYDATAADLGECFTSTPDFRPYTALPSDRSVFDPRKSREPLDPKPSPQMDDPREIQREHSSDGK